MATIEQQEGYAFAESVRKQALRIATLIAAGKTEDAASAALLLCSQSQQQKRRITGTPEPEAIGVDHDEDGYNLSVFNEQFGTPEEE